MYIRPQLSRRRTIDHKVLSEEHDLEMKKYDRTLKDSEKYNVFVDKIAILIDEMKKDDNLSLAEKEPILNQLKLLLSDVEQEYRINVENKQKEIDYSSKQRLAEMSEAKTKIINQKNHVKNVLFETDEVDKNQIEKNISLLLEKYLLMEQEAEQDFLERQRKSDLYRNNIRKRLSESI